MDCSSELFARLLDLLLCSSCEFASEDNSNQEGWLIPKTLHISQIIGQDIDVGVMMLHCALSKIIIMIPYSVVLVYNLMLPHLKTSSVLNQLLIRKHCPKPHVQTHSESLNYQFTNARPELL